MTDHFSSENVNRPKLKKKKVCFKVSGSVGIRLNPLCVMPYRGTLTLGLTQGPHMHYSQSSGMSLKKPGLKTGFNVFLRLKRYLLKLDKNHGNTIKNKILHTNAKLPTSNKHVPGSC